MSSNDGSRLLVFGVSVAQQDNRKMQQVLRHYKRLPSNPGSRMSLFIELNNLARELMTDEAAQENIRKLTDWMVNGGDFPLGVAPAPLNAADMGRAQSALEARRVGGRQVPIGRPVPNYPTAYEDEDEEDDEVEDEMEDEEYVPAPAAVRNLMRGRRRAGSGHRGFTDAAGRYSRFGRGRTLDNLPENENDAEMTDPTVADNNTTEPVTAAKVPPRLPVPRRESREHGLMAARNSYLGRGRTIDDPPEAMNEDADVSVSNTTNPWAAPASDTLHPWAIPLVDVNIQRGTAGRPARSFPYGRGRTLNDTPVDEAEDRGDENMGNDMNLSHAGVARRQDRGNGRADHGVLDDNRRGAIGRVGGRGGRQGPMIAGMRDIGFLNFPGMNVGHPAIGPGAMHIPGMNIGDPALQNGYVVRGPGRTLQTASPPPRTEQEALEDPGMVALIDEDDLMGDSDARDNQPDVESKISNDWVDRLPRHNHDIDGTQDILQDGSSVPPLDEPEEEIECPICLEEYPASSFPKRPTITDYCDHPDKPCLQCLDSSIDAMVSRGALRLIACPICPQKLSYYEIQEYASEPVFTRYAYLKQQSEIPGHFISCTAANCGSSQPHPGEDPMMVCNHCSHKTCATHKLPWHEGQTCTEFDCDEAQIERLEEEEATAKLLAKEDTSICPKCSQGVTKSEGCDHMQCACGQAWCYVCMCAWENIIRLGDTAHATFCIYHPNKVSQTKSQREAGASRIMALVHGGHVSSELSKARDAVRQKRREELRPKAAAAAEARMKLSQEQKKDSGHVSLVGQKKKKVKLVVPWEEGVTTKKSL